MRYLRALVLLGFGAALSLTAVPDVVAADLAVTERAVRVVHKRARVVRDYDGTPVLRREIRSVELRPDGGVLVAPQYEMTPVMKASPRYYLNGEPVLPQYPRGSVAVVTVVP